MPSVTRYRPARAHSWDCRHRLGLTLSGQPPSRKAVAVKSHTMRPSSVVMVVDDGPATKPRSAFSKSVRSAKSGVT